MRSDIAGSAGVARQVSKCQCSSAIGMPWKLAASKGGAGFPFAAVAGATAAAAGRVTLTTP